MSWLLRLVRRFGLGRSPIDWEIAHHLEELAERHRARGLSPAEARLAARHDFGGQTQVREAYREQRGLRFPDEVRQDLRYAFRSLGRTPGFTVAVVLILGLGIGVNTAIFGVLNAVLLRPLPVTDPDRLVILTRGEEATFSTAAYLEFRARSRSLSGLTASFPMESDLDIDGNSEFVAAEVVSGNYGGVLGVRPTIGRWFTSDTDAEAVISYSVWQRRFGGDPQVLGHTIRSESQIYTVVGVTAREFLGVFAPLRTDVWVPIRTRPGLGALLDNPVRRPLMLFGRLASDVAHAQAASELNAIARQLAVAPSAASEVPAAPIVAEPVQGIPNPGNRRLVQIIATLVSVVVGLVLLIACVNVANLLVVRGARRHREIAARLALGATRARIIRQLMTESVVLAVGGGVTGIALAAWTNRILARSLPNIATFGTELDLSLEWRLVAYAAAVSLATTVLCGLWPAWRASQVRVTETFRGELGAAERRPLGLIVQVAMSLVVLFIAGTFLQTLFRLQGTAPGFEVERRLYAHVFVPAPPFTALTNRAFYARAGETVRSLPGVKSVALTDTLPLMPAAEVCVAVDGGSQVRATSGTVDVGYFGTLGIKLVSGRDFTADDEAPDAPAVIVNESLARRMWPNRSAIDERVFTGCEGQTRAGTVVGVVADVAVRTVGEPAQPHLYRPFARESTGGLTTLIVESSTPAENLVQVVRRSLVGMGQGVRVYTVQSLGQHVEQSFGVMRWQTRILAGLGLLALLLAAIGLYAVIAYRVTRRTREIGVRMALGAAHREIFGKVVTEGLLLVAIGVVAGEILAVGSIRVVSARIPGIAPADTSTYVTVAAIWLVVAFVACYIPARRAARVDPLEALRAE